MISQYKYVPSTLQRGTAAVNKVFNSNPSSQTQNPRRDESEYFFYRDEDSRNVASSESNTSSIDDLDRDDTFYINDDEESDYQHTTQPSIIESFNQHVEGIYQKKLKERSLEALAYYTCFKQLIRYKNARADDFREIKLKRKVLKSLRNYQNIQSKLDIFRLRAAFYKL